MQVRIPIYTRLPAMAGSRNPINLVCSLRQAKSHNTLSILRWPPRRRRWLGLDTFKGNVQWPQTLWGATDVQCRQVPGWLPAFGYGIPLDDMGLQDDLSRAPLRRSHLEIGSLAASRQIRHQPSRCGGGKELFLEDGHYPSKQHYYASSAKWASRWHQKIGEIDAPFRSFTFTEFHAALPIP